MLLGIINKISFNFFRLFPFMSIKQDTEKILELIKEYEDCLNIKEFKKLKRKYEREVNLRSSILDHLDDMVWCKDLDGKYLMTNKSFREKFCYGFNDADILGKTDIELAKEFKAKLAREQLMLTGDTYSLNGVDYQISFTKNDGDGLVQVKSAFELGLANTVIVFENGTKLPITANEFIPFASWFVTKRNEFFT